MRAPDVLPQIKTGTSNNNHCFLWDQWWPRMLTHIRVTRPQWVKQWLSIMFKRQSRMTEMMAIENILTFLLINPVTDVIWSPLRLISSATRPFVQHYNCPSQRDRTVESVSMTWRHHGSYNPFPLETGAISCILMSGKYWARTIHLTEAHLSWHWFVILVIGNPLSHWTVFKKSLRIYTYQWLSARLWCIYIGR